MDKNKALFRNAFGDLIVAFVVARGANVSCIASSALLSNGLLDMF